MAVPQGQLQRCALSSGALSEADSLPHSALFGALHEGQKKSAHKASGSVSASDADYNRATVRAHKAYDRFFTEH